MSTELSIIKGTIYNEQRKVIWNAIIKVTEIDPVTQTYNELGYTLTDRDGNYAFALNASIDYIYQLTIYPPINE